MSIFVKYLRSSICKYNGNNIILYLILILVTALVVLSTIIFNCSRNNCSLDKKYVLYKKHIPNKSIAKYINENSSSFAKNEKLRHLTKGNRESCCYQLQDICTRKNCTMSCPDPQQLSNVESYPFQNSRNGYEEKVFFIETSGSGTLNIRQACAVESLALHNRNLETFVLFMDAQINTSVFTLKNLIKRYKNIRLVSINVNEYVAGTPLEHWYHCTNWRKGPYHVSHLSDGLRFLTLQKYGGYYFDLDVIHVLPVTYYRNFFCAASDNHYLASGVIHAGLNNPIMEFAVKDFVLNYRADVWGHNGPALILRVLKQWCNVKDLQSMDYISCRGINILPKSSFQPVYYGNMIEFFIHRLANNKTEEKPAWLTEKVVGIHTFNNLSFRVPIYKNSTQYYTRIARDNCPFIFSMAPEIF